MKLTQEEFARKLNAVGSAVQNWESGRNRPAPKYLRKMAELAPAFAPEVAREIEGYEWHPRVKAHSRYSPAVRDAMVEAIDLILERAPSAVVENVMDVLQKRAGKYGTPPSVGADVVVAPDIPAPLAKEIERLSERAGLDTSVIILSALETGLHTLHSDSLPADLRARVEKQISEFRRRAVQRVQSRQKEIEPRHSKKVS